MPPAHTHTLFQTTCTNKSSFHFRKTLQNKKKQTLHRTGRLKTKQNSSVVVWTSKFMVLGGNGLPSVAGGFIPGRNQTMFEMKNLGMKHLQQVYRWWFFPFWDRIFFRCDITLLEDACGNNFQVAVDFCVRSPVEYNEARIHLKCWHILGPFPPLKQLFMYIGRLRSDNVWDPTIEHGNGFASATVTGIAILHRHNLSQNIWKVFKSVGNGSNFGYLKPPPNLSLWKNPTINFRVNVFWYKKHLENLQLSASSVHIPFWPNCASIAASS